MCILRYYAVHTKQVYLFRKNQIKSIVFCLVHFEHIMRYILSKYIYFEKIKLHLLSCALSMSISKKSNYIYYLVHLSILCSHTTQVYIFRKNRVKSIVCVHFDYIMQSYYKQVYLFRKNQIKSIVLCILSILCSAYTY